jgi:hypothetical protein
MKTSESVDGAVLAPSTVRNFFPMEQAPKDGTEIRLLIRHRCWVLAHAYGNQNEWEQEVTGKWINHNGGGWTWHGMAGEPVGFYIPNVKEHLHRHE